jgi:hypothetical protein
MQEQKVELSERIITIFTVLFFAIPTAMLFVPLAIFEINAHSGISTEYTITKRGWVVHNVFPSSYNYITIRDIKVAKIMYLYRGAANVTPMDTFRTKNLSTNLMKDRYYEFNLKCIKMGNLPNLLQDVSCEIVSLKELRT